MAVAVCVLVGVALGSLVFTEQNDGSIHISGTISGLTPGRHGFHIHQYGDLREGCKAAGGHFNPQHMTHGAPTDSVRHVGDLGNIVADLHGVAEVNITDSVISFSGTNNIISRSVVVHAGVDDLGRGDNAESKLTGNAGSRLSCGVIGIAA